MVGIGDKWPRKYAEQIIAQPDKEARKRLFDQVPDELKDIVWAHCVTATRMSHGQKGKG